MAAPRQEDALEFIFIQNLDTDLISSQIWMKYKDPTDAEVKVLIQKCKIQVKTRQLLVGPVPVLLKDFLLL